MYHLMARRVDISAWREETFQGEGWCHLTRRWGVISGWRGDISGGPLRRVKEKEMLSYFNTLKLFGYLLLLFIEIQHLSSLSWRCLFQGESLTVFSNPFYHHKIQFEDKIHIDVMRRYGGAHIDRPACAPPGKPTPILPLGDPWGPIVLNCERRNFIVIILLKATKTASI